MSGGWLNIPTLNFQINVHLGREKKSNGSKTTAYICVNGFFLVKITGNSSGKRATRAW